MSLLYLYIEKMLEVVRSYILHQFAIGRISLYHHSSRLTATCSAAYLHQHLKSILFYAEIGKIKQIVGIEHRNKPNVREVQPLGNHLCADHYVEVLCLETPYNILERATATCSIEIESAHPCFGEELLGFGLHLFRAET